MTKRLIVTVVLGFTIAACSVGLPASAALVQYWYGSHAAAHWKFSSLTTITGGNMYISSAWHHGKMETRTAGGSVLFMGEVIGDGQVNYNHPAYGSTRSWCTWQPWPIWNGTPVSVPTICRYTN